MTEAGKREKFINQEREGAYDVAIVGGGFGGTTAAILLARKGLRVALVDLHAVYPPDFRAEKIAGDQLDRLRANGLLDCIVRASTPVKKIVNARQGRVVDEKVIDEYGLYYQDMVRALRSELPTPVDFIVGKVTDVRTTNDLQAVTLANGRKIEARLAIVATGLGDALRKKLGVSRRLLRDSHSLSIGFSIEPAPEHPFRFSGLAYYGDHPSAKVDYLSVFPIGNEKRVNLFVYREYHDPWVQRLKANPREAVFELLPKAQRFLGNFSVVSKVELRPVDLTETENYLRDGFVLIGDAFKTSCPAVGTGLSRLLADVDRLCNVYIPQWIATPGMGAEKIAAYYADADKRAVDDSSAHSAEYRRASTIGTSLKWEVHRRQHFFRRRVRNWLRSMAPGRRAA